jgi:hypothetical protein
MSHTDKYKIAKTIELSDGSEIILFDMLMAPSIVSVEDVEQNIYRRDRHGKVIWRISAAPPVYPRSPFTGIGYDDQGRLLAYRWEGGQYQIDLNTGGATALQLSR